MEVQVTFQLFEMECEESLKEMNSYELDMPYLFLEMRRFQYSLQAKHMHL